MFYTAKMTLKQIISLLHLIKKLAAAKTKNRIRSILEENSCLCNCICEITLNTLKSRIPLSKARRNKLYKYKNVLRSLAKKSVPRKQKVKLINQKGAGFLPALLIRAISFLAEVAAKKFIK